jgi:hypothetical protein
MTSENGKSAVRSTWSRAIGLGTDLLAGMLVFTAGGYWVDQKRHTGLFWTLCGMFLGILYGGYEVWKLVRAINAEDARRDAGKSAGPGAGAEA